MYFFMDMTQTVNLTILKECKVVSEYYAQNGLRFGHQVIKRPRFIG